jgi:hypothetical protein
MKASNPPALAAWLLENFRFGAPCDALAGDLLEQFHQGRSSAWYWRQALAAILIAFTAELRNHKALAIQAVLFSWVANFGSIILGRRLMFEVDHRLFAVHPFPASILISVLGSVLSGFLISCLYREHRNAMLLTCAGTLPAWAIMAIAFLKKGALQHPFPQIAVVAILYCAVALPGFVIGGLLLPARKTAARSSS